MKQSRRSWLFVTAIAATTVAADAVAQFGGRNRGNGPGGGQGNGPNGSGPPNGNPRANGAGPADPMYAIDRELASLRIDLRLTAEQSVLFDSFERQVRNAADASRMRARHVSAFRSDDAGPVTADTVLRTMADDDSARADAMGQALDRMIALLAALTIEQRKQFDRRIIQALRDPLGNS